MQQVLPRIATVFKCLHIPHVPIGAHGLVINFKRCANNTGFTSGIREISNTRRNEKGEEPGESEVVKPIVGDSIASKSRSKLPRYSPEKLVVDQFSKRVQEIWMYYKTNPTKEVDLRELCKGSRATILEVARLGKSMSMAADPETYNCASRLLFDAERLGSRFAALFIVNMALRVESALHHPRVVKAVEHVFKLANLPGDLAALTLKARYLQHQGKLENALATYLQAYELLNTFVPEKPENEVVGGPDLLYAFAMFKINSGSPEEYFKALDMLKEAALEGGHMAACLQLQGKLESTGPSDKPEYEIHSELHNQLLLKLAVSGHHAAAHELGKLYALPENEFKLLDPQLQRDIEDSPSVSLKASIPLGFKRMMLALNSRIPGSGLVERVKARFEVLKLIAFSSTKHKNRTLSRSLEKSYHQKVTTRGNERFYKALDWFHFGRAVCFHPAMLDGARLAKKLNLPFETSFFYESARRIPEKERQHPFEEIRLEREVYESAGQQFLADGHAVYECDYLEQVHMVQRISPGHISDLRRPD